MITIGPNLYQFLLFLLNSLILIYKGLKFLVDDILYRHAHNIQNALH